MLLVFDWDCFPLQVKLWVRVSVVWYAQCGKSLVLLKPGNLCQSTPFDKLGVSIPEFQLSLLPVSVGRALLSSQGTKQLVLSNIEEYATKLVWSNICRLQSRLCFFGLT